MKKNFLAFLTIAILVMGTVGFNVQPTVSEMEMNTTGDMDGYTVTQVIEGLKN